MSTPAHWIEHRRGDGELIDWIVAAGQGFTAVDFLEREDQDETPWDVTQERLEQAGIGSLADKYELLLETGE